ncbi:DNA repair protein RadA [Candidatus Dojkabacteria bacterium]|jgi:DNA repair protein RadA/Sms|nr:DNA repair protein RadA [Candidatus Dojkabacteria bacterium]
MKYICSSCSAEFLKWSGKCSSCGEWGTLEETQEIETISSSAKEKSVKASSFKSITEFSGEKKKILPKERMSTGYEEFDRVLGKGLVEGEVVLLSGEPGVGKSTLLMQIVLNFTKKGKVLYVCGEESPTQLNERLERVADGKLKGIENFVVTEDVVVENVVALIEQENFSLVVIDSIQSMQSLQSKGYPGSISQVRLSGALLTRVAKTTGVPIFIVGQINKGGDIAGPKVLEHIVDCVLYMEGDQYNQYRIVRSMKNRFGSTNEIGVFEMRGNGLVEVGNPSLLFLESTQEESGSAIGAVIQGSRVVFVEVQALVVERESEGGPLRRVANGIKKPRLDMLCAVMSRKGKVFLGNKDVFVNVVGGLTISDPAIDLAVCAAIKSSVSDRPLSKSVIYFGEVGLTGEVRGTWGVDSIIKEAERSGYTDLIVGRMKVGVTKKVNVKKIYKVSTL